MGCKNLSEQELEKKPEIRLHPAIGSWRTKQTSDPQLAKDIKTRGLLHRLTARRLPDGTLEIIAGTRRFRELGFAGSAITEDMLNIRENVSEEEALLLAYSENRYRKDMSPIEEARAFKSMKDLKWNVRTIGKKVKRSESYVRSRLALLGLPPEIQAMLTKGQFDFSYAVPLRKLDGMKAAQMALAKKIAKGQKHSYDGISTVAEAAKEVTRVLSVKKHKEDLVLEHGPCPKCGSKDISEEKYYDKEKLTCGKCKYEWNRETKDPWEFYEAKERLKAQGFEIKVEGPDKATLSPIEVADIIEKAKKEEKISPSFRSMRTLSEIIVPFLNEDNLLSVSVSDESVRIGLNEETGLNFRAMLKEYVAGEHSKIVVEEGWQDGDKLVDRMPKVKAFFKSLDKRIEAAGQTEVAE